MSIFVLKDGDQTYRVRKEEEGCSIFSSKFYIEGDDIIYDILYRISLVGVSQSINNIFSEYNEEKDVIKSDLIDMANSFIENCILINTANEIKKVLNVI